MSFLSRFRRQRSAAESGKPRTPIVCGHFRQSRANAIPFVLQPVKNLCDELLQQAVILEDLLLITGNVGKDLRPFPGRDMQEVDVVELDLHGVA